MKHLRKHLAALGAVLLAASVLLGPEAARATNCNSYTYTFTNGQTADANQVNSNFNTIMTCANSNLAHNGANSDITSLSGLTTPLSIAQGGTSGTTQTTAFNAIVAAGGSLTGGINWTKATLASASTVNIGAAAGNYIEITGTTTITAFDTVQAGTTRVLKFDGSLTLTNNATSLILPGGANITTNAGDVAIFISEGSGNWRCASYTFASDLPGKAAQRTILSSGTGTYTTPVGATWLDVLLVGGGGGGGGGGSGATGGSDGVTTTFGTMVASAGAGGPGNSNNYAPQYPSSGGDINQSGQAGQAGSKGAAGLVLEGGRGGASPWGAFGIGGDGGAINNVTTSSGSGGTAGGFVSKWISSLTSSYSYTIGTGGGAGNSGTGGNNGNAGTPGVAIVVAHFN